MAMSEQWIKDMLAKLPCKVLPNGNIKTCPVRLAYPELFVAKAAVIDGETKPPKYSASLLFPKGADLSALVKEAVRVATEEKGDKWKAKLPNGTIVGKGKELISFPFRDGEDKEDKGGYEAGAYFLNVNSDKQPGVVNNRALAITNKDEIYGGVWALVTLRCFWYDVDMKKGVSFGLQNVQKIADDEPLGSSRTAAEEEFDVIDDDAAPANGATDLGGFGNLAGL